MRISWKRVLVELNMLRDGGKKAAWASVELARAEIRRLLVLVAEVESEAGFGFCAVDFDGEFGAGAVLAEEWVGGFEEDGFPAGNHVGKLGVEAGLAVKIEFVPVEAVGASKVHASAGHAVFQLRKRQDAFCKTEGAGHAGANVVGNIIDRKLRLALASHAEGVDFLLDLLVIEVGAGNAEVAA